MNAPRILVLAGSLRTGSYNRLLAKAAAQQLETLNAQVTLLDLADYPLPIYDGDLEQASGVPTIARELHAVIASHQGVFIASPEYNASVSPLLLNAIAWVSRVNENGGKLTAFGQPVFALGSASPGNFGGYRGLLALRQLLAWTLQSQVLPQVVAVGQAHIAFDEQGQLKDESAKNMLKELTAQLVKIARCVK